MVWVIWFKALILGLVEGLTEFLPVSSTGHLIVAGSLLDFHANAQVFDVAIQLGAVLAVVWEYRRRFLDVASSLTRDAGSQRFVLNLAVAFVPAAVVGLLFHKQIKMWLFNPLTVAVALIVGGLAILWIEKYCSRRPARVTDVDDMTPKDALVVGLAQVLALIPGTSRSGSTIMGGMLWGISRKSATEFSFFLAVPVMVAATFWDVLKNWHSFSSDDVSALAVGFAASFVFGLIAVKALLRFVSTRTFVPFAWYRIALGIVIVLLWQGGVLAA